MTAATRLIGVLLLLAAGSVFGADVPLSPGVAVNVNLSPYSFVAGPYVDVPAGTGKLEVAIRGTAGDADLYLRYGSPFPGSSTPADPIFTSITPELINRYTHYRSVSGGSNDSITVAPYSRQPLRAGRWYVAILNASAQAAPITLTATLTTTTPNVGISVRFDRPTGRFDPGDPLATCNVAPWNDTTPVAAVGGNSGTTLGQQRRNALLTAIDRLSTQLHSPVPIIVQACWQALGGTSDRATLAQAGPYTVTRDDVDYPMPWLPQKYSWYPITTTTRLAGTSPSGVFGGTSDTPDVVATFNSDIGSANVIGGAPFYYGYDTPANPRDTSLVVIAMHEISHGLGFLGLVNDDASVAAVGARFSGNGSSGFDAPGYDDVFSREAAIIDNNGANWLPFLGARNSDANRAAAMVSVSNLRWSGAEAANSPLNANAGRPAPGNFPLLYAPCNRDAGGPCKTEPGSTLSHLAQAGQLMNAFYQPAARDLGLAVPMLHAIGWGDAAASPPQYTLPMTGNWYDSTRSGHGFDFQVVQRDPRLGDIYYVTFYTYDADGNPELYSSTGRLVDGVYVGAPDSSGRTLYRVTHGATGLVYTYVGTLVIDFNQATASPECRSADRSGAPQLGLMSWTIDGVSGQWCVQPLVPDSTALTPNFNGHWYAPSNSGWGMEVILADVGNPLPYAAIGLYTPDAQGIPRWTSAQTFSFQSGVSVPLMLLRGYCRTCPPVPVQPVEVGRLTLTLAEPSQSPAAGNRADISIRYPGSGGTFQRSAIPITLLSLPPGR